MEEPLHFSLGRALSSASRSADPRSSGGLAGWVCGVLARLASVWKKGYHAHVGMGLVRRNGGMQLSKLPCLFILSFCFPAISGAVEGAPRTSRVLENDEDSFKLFLKQPEDHITPHAGGRLQDLSYEADSSRWPVEDDKIIHAGDSNANGYPRQVCRNRTLH